MPVKSRGRTALQAKCHSRALEGIRIAERITSEEEGKCDQRGDRSHSSGRSRTSLSRRVGLIVIRIHSN